MSSQAATWQRKLRWKKGNRVISSIHHHHYWYSFSINGVWVGSPEKERFQPRSDKFGTSFSQLNVIVYVLNSFLMLKYCAQQHYIGFEIINPQFFSPFYPYPPFQKKSSDLQASHGQTRAGLERPAPNGYATEPSRRREAPKKWIENYSLLLLLLNWYFLIAEPSRKLTDPIISLSDRISQMT